MRYSLSVCRKARIHHIKYTPHTSSSTLSLIWHFISLTVNAMTVGCLKPHTLERLSGMLLALTFLTASMPAWSAVTPWDKIIPNTSLKLPDQPKWLNYATRNRFPNLSFDQPVQIVFQSTFEDGFFVVEKPGIIRLVQHREQSESTPFLDLRDRVYNFSESGLLSMAFHPNFHENGRFFVFYTARESIDRTFFYYNRLSEFKVDPNFPSQALKESEKLLINLPDRHHDHNGGGMLFGPDGYLYLSIGDEGRFYDFFGHGQKLTRDLFAGMLRIDVDKKPGNPPPAPHAAVTDGYAIPADNPFVGIESYRGQDLETDKLRTEFYAIGMRNPWRFVFDPLTGKLYSGDTGDHTREEINEIVSGGNYGWPHREGSLPGPPDHAIHQGDHGFIDPMAEYGREDGNDIAAMTVYRGTAFPELDGCVLFSDFYGGWLGKTKINQQEPSPIEWFAWDVHIADMTIDPKDGNILLVDMMEGIIKEFIPPSENNFEDIPTLLSETGAFLDTKTFTLDPSFIPYQINVPFWSDHAVKSRWISFSSSEAKINYHEEDTWGFPPGTVFMKHFNLELERGNRATAKRLETRFLVLTAFGGFYGLTYKWNETQDDAILISPDGLKEAIQIREENVEREQTWPYPGRHDCMTCHNGGPGFLSPTRFGRYALGFGTAQLNKEIHTGTDSFNQLAAMDRAGILTPPLDKPVGLLPKLVDANNEEASLYYRVRSYLAANCESCHEGIAGTARLSWNATFRAANDQVKLIDHSAYNNLGITGGRLIHRSDPAKSILLQRISRNGLERMPPLGSSELDHTAIDLIKRWILEDLGKPQSYADWAQLYFDDLASPESFLFSDPDGDGVWNFFEALTLSNPLDPQDFYAVKMRREGNKLSLELPGLSNRYAWVEWTETPSIASSWQFLNVQENGFFLPASSAPRTLDLEKSDLSKAFFRVKVRQ